MWGSLGTDIKADMESSSGRMGRIIVAITHKAREMVMGNSTTPKTKPKAEAFGRMVLSKAQVST